MSHLSLKVIVPFWLWLLHCGNLKKTTLVLFFLCICFYSIFMVLLCTSYQLSLLAKKQNQYSFQAFIILDICYIKLPQLNKMTQIQYMSHFPHIFNVTPAPGVKLNACVGSALPSRQTLTYSACQNQRLMPGKQFTCMQI